MKIRARLRYPEIEEITRELHDDVIGGKILLAVTYSAVAHIFHLLMPVA